MSAADQLIEVLRQLDKQLREGLASREIADREQRSAGQIVQTQVNLELPPGARPMVLALLLRNGIKHAPKPRSRSGALIVSMPSVFCREVFMPMLDHLNQVYGWYLADVGQEIADRALWSREADEVSVAEGGP
ncbi:MAG TPA: hypothetical protein PKA64_11415 [Myxococcota bacterium]|nr:hypothetical protein [Myxococcota bacterium]